MLAGTVSMAEVKLPAIFSNDMVIQRDTNAPVWGWADAGEKVTVTGSWGKKAEAVTAKNGKWEVKIATPKAVDLLLLRLMARTKLNLKM